MLTEYGTILHLESKLPAKSCYGVDVDAKRLKQCNARFEGVCDAFAGARYVVFSSSDQSKTQNIFASDIKYKRKA